MNFHNHHIKILSSSQKYVNKSDGNTWYKVHITVNDDPTVYVVNLNYDKPNSSYFDVPYPDVIFEEPIYPDFFNLIAKGIKPFITKHKLISQGFDEEQASSTADIIHKI